MSIFTTKVKGPGTNYTEVQKPHPNAKGKVPMKAARHGAGRPVQSKGAGYKGDLHDYNGPRKNPPMTPANQDKSKPRTGPAR